MKNLVMREAPFVCLFCGTTQGPFMHIEHPIPESMGNYDTILPKGFVCDGCNQYFGSKIEQQIMANPPFNLERVAASIKTRKHRYAKYADSSLVLRSVGFWDRVLFTMTPDRYDTIFNKDKGILWAEPPMNYRVFLARFLIKMGLELLAVIDAVDPYSTGFDKARLCSRYGNDGASWEVAYGLYPRRRDLVKSKRLDEVGPLETRQIYQWEMGFMPNGDCQIFFAYINHCFACNLSNPSIQAYVTQFNIVNEFQMRLLK
jgi:hypothetical protein